MRKPAGDRCLMSFTLEICPDRLVAGGAGEIGAAVEHAVLGIDGFGMGSGAGISARRMAGDEIVDFKPILDGADALFEAALLRDHDKSPNCDSRRVSSTLSLRRDHYVGRFLHCTRRRKLASLWRKKGNIHG